MTSRPKNQVQTTAPQASTAVAVPGETLEGMLKRPDIVARFAQAMPKHFSAERMLRLISLAAFRSPNLAKCNPWTVIGAGLTLGSLGLEPNTPLGHAYLVPFRNSRASKQAGQDVYELQVLIGYQGKMELWHRSGLVRGIEANVVYEGDEFDFEFGSNAHLKFRPQGDREGRKPLYVYAYAKLRDGGEMFEVWPYPRVLQVRNKSQAYRQALEAKSEYGENARGWKEAPWVAFEEEMACKTMLHRLNKRMPKSVELQNAQVIEELFDRRAFDFGRVGQNPELLSMPEAAETLEGSGEPDPRPEAKPQASKPTQYDVITEDGRVLFSGPLAEAAQQFAFAIAQAGNPGEFCEVNGKLLGAIPDGTEERRTVDQAIKKAQATVERLGGQEAMQSNLPLSSETDNGTTTVTPTGLAIPLPPVADGGRDWTSYYQQVLKASKDVFPGDLEEWVKAQEPQLAIMDREAKGYATDLRAKLNARLGRS